MLWKVPLHGRLGRRLRRRQAQRLLQHAGDAPLHFLRRAPAECQQHHALRIGAMADQVGDAMRQRAGLAGARAGDHQQRAGVVRLVAGAVLHRRQLLRG